MDIAVVVGNPKPRSRTLDAATRVASALAGGPVAVEVDLVSLGPGLLAWGDPGTAAAVKAVCACEAAVFASPTFKATYSGLLKLFLDQIPAGGLAGTVALPLMLGAGMRHALAPELLLKPVLVELGAICPTRGLYLLDSDYESPAELQPWLDDALRFTRRTVTP
jgi:FMN reductase